jgi:hypothetical protein
MNMTPRPSDEQKAQDRAFDKGADDWNRDRGIASKVLAEFVKPSYDPPPGRKEEYDNGRRYAERKHEEQKKKQS